MITSLSANQAAFATTVGLAVVSIGSGVGAATSATKVAQVALLILSLGSGAAGIGAITAWFETRDGTAKEYFDKFKEHAAISIAGFAQFASGIIGQYIIHGIGEGIGTWIRRTISGADRKIEHTVRHEDGRGRGW